jgi:hypothetical protein
MNRYIEVKSHFVMFAPPCGFKIDCSDLIKNKIVFVGEDENGFWYEHEPFTGKNRNTDNALIESLFNVAKQEFDDYQKNTQPTKEQIRINELKNKLSQSDYKVLPDYDKPDNGIRAQRQEWREEIRQLEE